MSRPAPGEFYGNPDWDVDAWVEVIGVEYERLIGAFPFDAVFRGLGGSIDLLDVGCGTAIFPSYLDAVLSDGVRVRADLLDRSEASLAIADEVIAGLDHFSVGRTFHAYIEDLPEFGEGEFDVIWAIHSFTTVDRDRMPRAYQRLLAALRPGGWLLVYQLTAASAYQRVHDRYRA